MSDSKFDDELERLKLNALAEFAAGAGHEINNPLAIISGHAQLLLKKTDDPNDRRRLATIISQVNRAYEMIADVRLFARPPRPQRSVFSLEELLQKFIFQMKEDRPGVSFILIKQEDVGRRSSETNDSVSMENDDLDDFDESDRSANAKDFDGLGEFESNEIDQNNESDNLVGESNGLSESSGFDESVGCDEPNGLDQSDELGESTGRDASENGDEIFDSTKSGDRSGDESDKICFRYDAAAVGHFVRPDETNPDRNEENEIRLCSDDAQIMTILTALGTNAAEATSEQGTVRIFYRLKATDRRRFVEIVLEDDGPGVPKKIREQIFSPYFSGRSFGRGLGFGLSKSWALVRQLGGRLSVTSPQFFPQGCRWILELPLEN